MKTLRWIGIALLFFLSASAIMGSLPMIANPGGEPWNMPQVLLKHSPFISYLVPGMILLVANGLLAFWALWLALAAVPHYSRWMTLQGCILLGWLAVECVMLRVVVWPHYLYGAIAAGLIAAGLMLWRAENRNPPFLPAGPSGEGI